MLKNYAHTNRNFQVGHRQAFHILVIPNIPEFEKNAIFHHHHYLLHQ